MNNINDKNNHDSSNDDGGDDDGGDNGDDDGDDDGGHENKKKYKFMNTKINLLNNYNNNKNNLASLNISTAPNQLQNYSVSKNMTKKRKTINLSKLKNNIYELRKKLNNNANSVHSSTLLSKEEIRNIIKVSIFIIDYRLI